MTAIFSPVFWIGLLVAFVAGAGTGFFKGEAHVQAKWDEDKAARMAHLAQVVVDNVAAGDKADAEARQRQADSAAAFDSLKKRNAQLSAKLDASRVDGVVLDELRAAVRAANAKAGVAPGVPKGTPAAPGTSATGTQVSDWFDSVAQLYRDCRDEVIGFQGWWDSLKW